MDHIDYQPGTYVLLVDNAFPMWRFYEVDENRETWKRNPPNLHVLVAKKKKRQSPARPSWHQPFTYYDKGVAQHAHVVPRHRIYAVFENEDAAEYAFQMMRDIHTKMGVEGWDVWERLKLVIQMTRSDATEA